MDFHYYQWSIVQSMDPVTINGSMIDGWTKIAHKDTNTQWIRYLEPPCLPTGTNEGYHKISAYHFNI